MLRTLLAIVTVPAALLVAWLALQDSSPRADFVFSSPEPRTLDPQRVSFLSEIQLAAAMFEGLTRLNAATFQPEPAVAATWDFDADRSEYTFILRPAARWSTGEVVVAEDFRFAWLRALDPKCEAQYASLLFVIRGAEEYYQSRANDDARDDVPAGAVGIEAVDEGTLRVRLAHPCPYFLDLTSFITLAPVHRPTLRVWAYRDDRVLRATQHLWMRPEHIVCNGAFVLRHWEFKQRLWLERNPYYWDAATIELRSIEAYVTGNPNAALVAYETGRVDLVSPLERAVAENLLAQQRAGGRTDFHSSARFATYFYRVNCGRPPLNSPDLRKALSLAIDRTALCTHVLRLGEEPAYHLVPTLARERLDYSSPGGLGAGLPDAERVALAREYLRRSGFDRVAASRPLEIAFPPEPEQRLIAEAVQAMWEAALGIRVELRTIESKVLSTKIRTLDYDVARSDWFGDYLDPSAFLELFTTDSAQNRTGWADRAYDRLIAAAAHEGDRAARFDLLQQAEGVLCEEELPVISIFFRRGNFLLSPRFEGVHDNERDLLQVHRARAVR